MYQCNFLNFCKKLFIELPSHKTLLSRLSPSLGQLDFQLNVIKIIYRINLGTSSTCNMKVFKLNGFTMHILILFIRALVRRFFSLSRSNFPASHRRPSSTLLWFFVPILSTYSPKRTRRLTRTMLRERNWPVDS